MTNPKKTNDEIQELKQKVEALTEKFQETEPFTELRLTALDALVSESKETEKNLKKQVLDGERFMHGRLDNLQEEAKVMGRHFDERLEVLEKSLAHLEHCTIDNLLSRLEGLEKEPIEDLEYYSINELHNLSRAVGTASSVEDTIKTLESLGLVELFLTDNGTPIYLATTGATDLKLYMGEEGASIYTEEKTWHPLVLEGIILANLRKLKEAQELNSFVGEIEREEEAKPSSLKKFNDRMAQSLKIGTGELTTFYLSFDDIVKEIRNRCPQFSGCQGYMSVAKRLKKIRLLELADLGAGLRISHVTELARELGLYIGKGDFDKGEVWHPLVLESVLKKVKSSA